MESYSSNIDILRKSVGSVSDAIYENNEEKLNVLKDVKESISSQLLTRFCNGMVELVQDHVAKENEKMQQEIISIDEDLTQSASLMDSITSHRSKLIEMYNSVTTPQLVVDVSMGTCVKDGMTMASVQHLQTQTQETVGNINSVRMEHEPLFNEIQTVIYAKVEESFLQLEEKVLEGSRATTEKVQGLVASAEEDLSSAEDTLAKIVMVQEKLKMFLNCQSMSTA